MIHQAKVPKASPDPGEDGHPTYGIPVVKYRRGGGRYFETRDVTDDGAGSPGRLITEALQATRFARAVVEDLAPGTDLLIVWRWAQGGHAITSSDHPPPVGIFRFGVADSAGSAWARSEGLDGSPFRRGRAVNALVRREPGQNSQATHDRDYVLVDQRVQQEAADIIAAGAEDAAERSPGGPGRRPGLHQRPHPSRPPFAPGPSAPGAEPPALGPAADGVGGRLGRGPRPAGGVFPVQHTPPRPI